MHILVTNDDGPPSAESSPYLLPFVRHLEAAGHLVSVVVPSEQRSWIAKAHMIGQDVVAKPYLPPPYSFPSDKSSSSTLTKDNQSGTKARPWFTLNSTPASCSVVGLHHLFAPTELPPIDLLVSGPNYGRNTTAVFALSSGTLGAALEGAVSGYKSIALSFAFFDRSNPPDIVAEACRHSVKVVEYLAKNGEWNSKPEGMSAVSEGENKGGVVYSVNVPLVKGVESAGTEWTSMLQNRWFGSCFTEQESKGDEEPGKREREIRTGGAEEEGREEEKGGKGERHFKWSPKFTDVYESVKRAGEGSDGWAVAEGRTSVTALRANFMHLENHKKGILKL